MTDIDVLLSNALADLAEQVRTATAAADEANSTAIGKMVEAGRMLCTAKDECPHGQWTAFLERAGIHERKARRLMQLARSGLKTDTVSVLGGLKPALEYIAKRDAAAKLPLPAGGNVVVARATDWQSVIWESEEHRGFFHIDTVYCRDPDDLFVEATRKPVKGEPGRLGDGTFVFAVWEQLNVFMRGRAAECDYETVSDLEKIRRLSQFLPEGGHDAELTRAYDRSRTQPTPRRDDGLVP